MSVEHHLTNARGETKTLPAWLYVRGFERPITHRIVTHDAGQVISRTPVRRATRGTLEGTLIGVSFDNALAELDDLLRFLHFTPIQLRNQGPAARYLDVYPELVDDTRTTLAHRRALQIPLVAPNPWWIGTARTDVATISGTVSRIITNAGSAPTPATITLANGSATNPVVTNLTNDHALAYGNALGAGDTLVANGERRTLTLNAANALGAAGDAFIAYGFWLLPGDNTIQLQTGGTAIDQTIAWTERFW